MELEFLDILIFAVFILIVISFSLYKGKKSETSEDYFLAGRGLSWGLIGISLIAANISTEQFVGMSGSSAGNVGLAIASYEWMPAITLVVVAIFFLPSFIKSGIYTIPEFLEYRYSALTRSIMAFFTMIIFVTVTISAVLYSGGLAMNQIFDINLTLSVWSIGAIAALYTVYGGLRSVAWADLFQGTALIVGGIAVTVIGISAVGGLPSFLEANEEKLHMFLPADHPVLPWTALLAGLWIPNFYYWGLNQYIMQRTLAAKSLKHGQLGVLFAAFLKLIMPLVTVVPGIIAFQLYSDQLSTTTDAAYPLLIRHLVPVGLKGFILAALAGAVISSLASMLNSASTIFTMDLYARHWAKNPSNKSLIKIGRAMTIIFVLVGCLIAPLLGNPEFHGIFNFIQDFQGYISPGILAAFVFGFIIKKAPPIAGTLALILNVPIYGILHLSTFDQISFLNKMALTFGIIIIVMGAVTLWKPLKVPVIMPEKKGLDLRTTPLVKILGFVLILITLSLYVVFR